MSKTFEETIKEIEKINKSLDKMKALIPKATDEEKEQIYVFMEYLEQQYRELQIKLWNYERSKNI